MISEGRAISGSFLGGDCFLLLFLGLTYIEI
jgi:hypothetical protein